MTCADAVKEAVKSLNRSVSTREVINYIYAEYPNRPWKESTISAHMIGCSVNHSSSKHYPSFPKFLHHLGQGRYRMYDPSTDGERMVDEKLVDSVKNEQEHETQDMSGVSFDLERDLEEQIIKNLNQIEDGMKLFVNEGVAGRQFNTDMG